MILCIFLGKDVYKNKLNELLSLNLEIIDADQTIAIRAGELHMIYKLPLGDALIAATGMNENIKHILTDDGHLIQRKIIKGDSKIGKYQTNQLS